MTPERPTVRRRQALQAMALGGLRALSLLPTLGPLATARRVAGLGSLGVAAGLSGLAAPTRAGPPPDWPQRPLRIIVVYPVGGVSDALARAMASRLALQLGVPVRVENRAGLGGSVGMDALASAAPDGYTLAFSAMSPLSLTPHLARVGYDPFKDIAPVMAVMYTPVLLVGTPAFEGSSFQDLLAQGRGGQSLRWASSGRATVGHLVLEQVRLASHANIVHIPYKGGGQQLNDALSGQFELLSTNMGAAQMQYIRAGKFKPLAVGSPARLKQLPDVPTFAELGFAPANLSSLFGFFAPGRTPDAVLRRLNTELNSVLQQPDIRSLLVSVDNLPTGGSAAEFSQRIAQDWESNRRLIQAAHLHTE